MKRNTTLGIATLAALIGAALYFFGQSPFERRDQESVVRVERDVSTVTPTGVSRDGAD